jgi:hypothetical protein
MSPINRCNLFLNRCLAKCTASLVLFGRETEAGPIGHLTELRSGVESTFSREQLICLILLGQRERLSRMGTARRKCMSAVRGLVRKAYVLCVSTFPL